MYIYAHPYEEYLHICINSEKALILFQHITIHSYIYIYACDVYIVATTYVYIYILKCNIGEGTTLHTIIYNIIKIS